MNQNSLIIKLADFTSDDHPFGNIEGRKVFSALVDFVNSHPSNNVFGLSLQGIAATDASFPRESVMSLAKQYRGEKGFYLEGFTSRDLVDNWNYAAQAKEQPMVIWNGDTPELIGPKVTPSVKALIDFVHSRKSVTASIVSEGLNITVPNASTKLKKLVSQGFILRVEEVAESGGVEYIYQAIK
ncbi:DNA-binding protein [Neptuniibacter pectenicola]|uniref:DNA-binding protein n=1 Tax=Neptuniibacter pectenicola TaxID=1806669 RepID=A0ABU9TS43_9GAMM